jgi:hypothetical protein
MAAPWSWKASNSWDGNDGIWNTFIVQVGTPPQDFRVLPSILEQAAWVPHPQGCTPDDPTDCPYDRGVLPFDGTNNTGFQANESSSWDLIGLYELSSYGEQMGYPGNGQFGFDNIALSNASDSLELPHQVVAAIADKSFYLGQFGLGPKPSNFTTFNDPIPNYMANLVSADKIPSMSFAYTAGAHYRDKAPASLVLGGHDENRYEPSELSFRMNADNVRPLQVGLQNILAENTLLGAVSLLPSSTYHLVDSTVPHIWLPDDAIDEFVSAFGLEYDNTTELYLVNDTIHEELLQRKPTVTFVLGNSSTEGIGLTQNIELPYAAFDLQAGYPFYENKTVNYFPIRRATNDTQYTIGRVFLQEACVIVDWETQNFTVAQARFDNLAEESLVPILSKASDESSNRTTTDEKDGDSQNSSALGAGAIAGIVVGVVLLLALTGIGGWLYLRKRKSKKVTAPLTTDEKPDDSSTQKTLYPAYGSELESSNMLNEMPSDREPSEADGVARWGRFSLQEAPTAPLSGMRGRSELSDSVRRSELGDNSRAEVSGDERHRHELPANEWQR